ncbi:MAG: hypothetical protein KJ799_09860 [Bacteroidetes bacterium]|nr:hypothetical protein [Patescibacteria group bacterium]MBU2507015.1 hypothetical protein [Bacteroidota bacterium]
MNTIKLRYKKDRKVFIPDREVDLPDNFEFDLPDIAAQIIDKEDLIREIKENGKKYIPGFKLSEGTKKLLGVLKDSPLRNFSDEELRRMYHENVKKKGNRVTEGQIRSKL